MFSIEYLSTWVSYEFDVSTSSTGFLWLIFTVAKVTITKLIGCEQICTSSKYFVIGVSLQIPTS